MRIFLTGATGRLGRRLVARLRGRGDSVVVLTRDAARAQAMAELFGVECVEGDPTCPAYGADGWMAQVSGCDAVVHLACSGLTSGSIDAQRLEALSQRRIDAVFQVASAICESTQPPRALLVLSNLLGAAEERAVQPLANVMRGLEQQAMRARDVGTRVAILRAGFMLSDDGVAARRLLGLTDAEHPVRWVHETDVLNVIEAALDNENASGVLEVSVPEPQSLAAMQSQLKQHALGDGERSTLPLGGEARALLARPQELRSVRGAQGACAFKQLELAIERPTLAPAPVTKRKATRSGARRLIVLPCEGLLFALAANGEMVARPGAVQAIALLHANNASVVLATSAGGQLALAMGRTLALANGAVEAVIAADGAVLLDPATGDALHSEVLAAQQIAAIAAAVRTVDARVSIVIERGIHVTADGTAPPEHALAGVTIIDQEVEAGTGFSRPASRLLLHAPRRRLQRVLEVVRETWWRSRVIAMRNFSDTLVAITAPAADRGVALQRAESQLGYARRRSIVVAASALDSGMLEFAGVGLLLPGVQDNDATNPAVRLEATDPAAVAAEVLARVQNSPPRTSPATR